MALLTNCYLKSFSFCITDPAAEMQAIDRTHRLGQHRCIRAVRFIAEGTVEERVLQLQEKKRLVFDGTVGRYVSVFPLFPPGDQDLFLNKILILCL